jgi:hypothetical protein
VSERFRNRVVTPRGAGGKGFMEDGVLEMGLKDRKMEGEGIPRKMREDKQRHSRCPWLEC